MGVGEAGQERFGQLIRVYYKQANACIVVFDLTRRLTFDVGIRGRAPACGSGPGDPTLSGGGVVFVAMQNVKHWKADLDEKVFTAEGHRIPAILLANKVRVLPLRGGVCLLANRGVGLFGVW